MKISLIIYSVLIAQVSTSFLDVFQGAMHSVQNSFGKLLTDVVTDVKETFDCTILAIEHVFSLSADATALYNDKCGGGNNTTVTNNQSKENNVPTLEISFSSNQDYLNKLLPGEIDSRINDTVTRIFKGYNPHDKLADVERELAKETKRLAGISDLVKRELEKLSAKIHIDLGRQLKNDTIPSVDNILQELRLLEAVEENIKNSSEANEIHKVIENVLHKLSAIEASEVSENNKVDKILKDLESSSNGTYKDLRKRLEDWKKEEDRHLDVIKNKIDLYKTSPEHSVYIEKHKSNNILEGQPYNLINNTGKTTEIIKNSIHTTQPDTIYKISKNSSSFAALNVTPLYGSTTNLVNVTTSTISSTLAPLGSLPKKSNDNGTPLLTETINNSTHTRQPNTIYKLNQNGNSFAALNVTPFSGATISLVNVTTSTIFPTLVPIGSLPKKSTENVISLSTEIITNSIHTRQPDTIYKIIKNSSSFAALNATQLYGSTTSLVNVTTSTISPTLALIGSLLKNSSVNVTSLLTDKSVTSTSTTTAKIERTKGNILTKSSTTDSGVHFVRSLYHSESKPVIFTIIPAMSSSTSVPLTPMKVSTISALSPVKTTLKNESSTISNDSDNNVKNHVSTLRTSTKRKNLMFKAPKTERSTIVPAKEKITPIIIHKEFSRAQTDDEITTPVSISTNSYVNKYKSSITESILNTVSPTTINSIANTLHEDLQPDNIFNETLTTSASSTMYQMVIGDVDHSISNTTLDVSSEISSFIPTIQRYHSNKHDLRGPVTSIQSTVVDSNEIQNVTIGSTTSQGTLEVSKHSRITTPSLVDFLKYIDRIVTSTRASTTTKSKDIPKSLAYKEIQDPWLTHSRDVISKATPDILNNNSIAPLNEKFTTRPYNHPLRNLNKVIPSLTLFKPSKTTDYHDPSLSARNDRFINKEKLLYSQGKNKSLSVPEISLQSRSSYESLKKNNAPFPYAGVNNNPAILKRNLPRSSRLMPINKRHDKNRASVVTNDKDPPESFNQKSDTQKDTHLKLHNFDDSDYDSFFHLPSKNAEHERALRDARKLIEDSQKAHRLMQTLLNKRKKGINAFNLSSSLNFGR